MSKTEKKSLIISSKFFWYTKELIPYLEKIFNVKTHIYKKNVLINSDQKQNTEYLNRLLKIIDFNFIEEESLNEIKKLTNFDSNLVLPPEILIPEWNWEITSIKIKELIQLILETKEQVSNFGKLIQIFLAGIARNLRVIGNSQHLLKRFLDSLVNYNTSIEDMLELYHKWIDTEEGKIWGSDNLPNQTIHIPYNIFIHLYRIPIEDNTLIERYLKEWFNFLSKSKLTYFLTDIPLISPKIRRFPVIQCVSEDQDISEIAVYWQIYASLVLRTLGYTVTKTPLIKFKESSFNLLLLTIFNKKLEKNMDKYVASCVNPSVTSSYKQYKKLMDRDYQYKRYSEFYMLYRGGILEKKYKKAVIDFEKNTSNKQFGRRANRRKKYLIDFIIDFFEVYGYLAFEGIYLYKFYKTSNFIDPSVTYDLIKEKWFKKEKILFQSTDPNDYPNIFTLDEQNKKKYEWLISLHKLKGFPDL